MAKGGALHNLIINEQRAHKKGRKKARKKLFDDSKDLFNKQIRDNIPDKSARDAITDAEVNPGVWSAGGNFRKRSSTRQPFGPNKKVKIVDGRYAGMETPVSRNFTTPSMSTQKAQTSMRYSRSRTRRPLRRRRLLRRRPSSRRTRTKVINRKRKGRGLKSLIRRIALEAGEPRRLVIDHDLKPVEDEFRVVAVSRLLFANLPTAANAGAFWKGRMQGARAQLKGIRVKGQIKNLSQLPCTVNMFFMKNKSKGIIEDLTNQATLNAKNMWYNALTGEAEKITNLTERFSDNPKMSKESPFKIIKKKSWFLSTNTAGVGLAGTEGERSDMPGVQDVIHFDMYFPCNHTVAVNRDASVSPFVEDTPQRFDTEYYVGWTSNPYDHEQQFGTVTNLGITVPTNPTVKFHSITYYKDF